MTVTIGSPLSGGRWKRMLSNMPPRWPARRYEVGLRAVSDALGHKSSNLPAPDVAEDE